MWTSLNSSIADIHSNGKIDLKSLGTTSISGLFGISNVVGKINVLSPAMSSLSVTGPAALAVSGSNQYKAIATYSDGSTLDVTNSVTWSSNHLPYATVSNVDAKKGMLTGISSGNIILSACMGSIVGTLPVGISNPTVSSIAISPAKILATHGQNIHYTALATFSDGTTADVTASAVWASSSLVTATFDSSSNVTVLAATGSQSLSTISATLRGTSGTTQLTVYNSNFMSLYFDHAGTVAVGSAIPIKVYANTSDGGTLNVTSFVTLSSDYPGVLSISNVDSTKGMAYGLSPGVATITASYQGMTSTQSFTVDPINSSLVQKGDGLRADYYSDTVLGNLFASRIDATPYFNWGGSPGSIGMMYYYSVRWTGFVKARATDANTYICTNADDGIHLYIDGVLVINDWNSHPATVNCTIVSWMDGSMHSIQMEYFQGSGGAVAELFWYSAALGGAIIPQTNLYSH